MNTLTSKTLDALPDLHDASWDRESSSLSSSCTVTRQMTLFTEQHAHGFAKKACTAYLAQGGGARKRQATEPVEADKVLTGMRRSTSFPAVPTFQTLGEIEHLVNHNDEGDDEESDGGLSLESSEASSCDELQGGVSPLLRAVLSAVGRCNSSLAVATPGGSGLTAVSQKLAGITGYTCEALLSFGARDCPALTHCLDDEGLQEAFHRALNTGANFVSLFVSRRHSGDLFLNLVHVRGLTLASAGADESGEGDFWILLMAFADVTGWDRQHLPKDHSKRLDKLARRINKYVQKEMAGHGVQSAFDYSGASLQLMSKAKWKSGCSGAPGPHQMLDKLALRTDLLGLLSVSPAGVKSDNLPPSATGDTFCSQAETLQENVRDLGRFPWLSFSVIAATIGLAIMVRCRNSGR
eukprot:TRINITY_DN21718_c0_g1_i1.p1 TRINITY_DN21718_c0_g1~~TRINITY_DN21718_c0_g1_i1.p1  ORF type:complete len:418 (-),score=64.79 TRINITY_DN21718_c0_g1_i1:117-1343(-)